MEGYKILNMNFFREKPADFCAEIEVVTCFIEWQNHLLLLQYPESHLFANRWAVPGGRIEKGESKESALERELFEELGLDQFDWNNIRWVQDAFVRRSIGDIQLHLFQWKLEKQPQVSLDLTEHLSYCWQRLDQLQQIDLIDNQYDTYRIVYE